MIKDLISYVRCCDPCPIDEGKQNLVQQMIERVKKEIDYRPVLESCCKRVIEQYNPYPSQCNLDYFHDGNNNVWKIHVKIDETIVGVVICGKFIESDDPMKLCYTKPYELNLTGDEV